MAYSMENRHLNQDSYLRKDNRFDNDSYSSHHWVDHCVPAFPSARPTAEKAGQVLLVGAGPGDPDLLTVKALRAIGQAEVVVYDRLVSRDIMQRVNPDAELVYVGKRCGRKSMSQQAISQLLVDLARSGKLVVRLKGGDPFIFGRGGEEALALVKHDVPYQVIPGITAAIGCAAAALIPLTHRQVSRSVTFVTGHVVTGSLPAWAELVRAGQTLVFYMGLEKAGEIHAGLLGAGLGGSTPVAIVGKGCSPQQEVHVSALANLPLLADELRGLSPALLILGEVVSLRQELLSTVNALHLHAAE